MATYFMFFAAVKVAACWLDFFLNLGGLTFRPLRLPLQELKKF